MQRPGVLAMLALAATLAGGCGAQEAPAKAPAATDGATGAKPAAAKSPGVDAGADPGDQIATQNGDPTLIESISGDASGGVDVEQTAGGRDLCDPSVSEATRRAAGVDCSARVEIGGPAPRAGLAKDPLLQPNNPEIKRDIEDLGLGDDVPATVILQN